MKREERLSPGLEDEMTKFSAAMRSRRHHFIPDATLLNIKHLSFGLSKVSGADENQRKENAYLFKFCFQMSLFNFTQLYLYSVLALVEIYNL